MRQEELIQNVHDIVKTMEQENKELKEFLYHHAPSSLKSMIEEYFVEYLTKFKRRFWSNQSDDLPTTDDPRHNRRHTTKTIKQRKLDFSKRSIANMAKIGGTKISQRNSSNHLKSLKNNISSNNYSVKTFKEKTSSKQIHSKPCKRNSELKYDERGTKRHRLVSEKPKLNKQLTKDTNVQSCNETDFTSRSKQDQYASLSAKVIKEMQINIIQLRLQV